jgi:hypothetical protein
MQDTANVGDVVAFGAQVTRWTTTDPRRRIPVDLASGQVIVTSPSAVAVTTLIAAMRHPDTGRYELDTTMTAAGIWQQDWSGSASFTDEDGNSRTMPWTKHDEVEVYPA